MKRVEREKGRGSEVENPKHFSRRERILYYGRFKTKKKISELKMKEWRRIEKEIENEMEINRRTKRNETQNKKKWTDNLHPVFSDLLSSSHSAFSPILHQIHLHLYLITISYDFSPINSSSLCCYCCCRLLLLLLFSDLFLSSFRLLL